MNKLARYTLLGLSLLSLIACTNQETASEVNTDRVQLVSQEKFQQVTEDYRLFVEEQIDQLLLDTEKWAEVIRAGNLELAKTQYPLIRMAYERSEPIAESFGELDIRIDFRLVDYIDENNSEDGWSGFHRLERILWEDNTTQGTEAYLEQLIKDIKELRVKVSTVEVTPELMTTGAIDLLNEVATSKITGEEEVYSHTDLYDFRANIEGAEKIFELFKPYLAEVDDSLVVELEKRFQAVNQLLDSHMVDEEHYKSYLDLSKEDTKALAEAVTKLGEPLSQMAVVLN